MQKLNSYSGKAISRAVLLHLTIIVLFFSAACKKNMESQADYLNTDLNTAATANSTSWEISNPGFNFYVTSSGGIAESSFTYYGAGHTGYVTLSGSALNATEYYSVSLNQGSNANYWNVTVNKTGSISAIININGVPHSLGTVFVYAISSGGVSVTAMPSTVHLTSCYKTTINAGDPGTLHFNFNWPAQPNSAFGTNLLFAALKVGEYVSYGTILNEASFQTYYTYVSDGTMHMQLPIPPGIDSRYMQIAFTTDYLDLHRYFNEQHAFTNFNQPSDPFLVTGLQSTTPVFNCASDFNVLKIINGQISRY